MVHDYLRPSSLDDALALKAGHPDGVFLAGGTFLLAGDYRDKPGTLIDLSRLLPRHFEAGKGFVRIGAGASFQDILEAPGIPRPIKAAAATMVNRNVRNRATLGGNLGAAKSCASLIPPLLALGAGVRTAGRDGFMPLEAWLARPEGILLEMEAPVEGAVRAAFRRHSRTACDISVLTCCVAYRVTSSGLVSGLKVAMGGLGPGARLFPELALLFEGRALPSREGIEAAARPLFQARSDWRGSAPYKELRAAALLADALSTAEAMA